MEQDELITSFFNLTGCFDLDVANKYLSQGNWNLSVAYSLYEQSEETKNPIANDPMDVDIPQEPTLTQYFKGALNWVLSPLSSIIKPSPQPSARVPRTESPVESFQKYLRQLSPPNCPRIGSYTLDTITQGAERANKLALVYIHQVEYGDMFVRTVLCNSEVISAINAGFIFLGILGNSNEGSEAIARFSDEVNAVFVILNSSQVVDRMEYLPSIDELLEFLLRYSTGSEEVFDENFYMREQQERDSREAKRQMEVHSEINRSSIDHEIRKMQKQVSEEVEKQEFDQFRLFRELRKKPYEDAEKQVDEDRYIRELQEMELREAEKQMELQNEADKRRKAQEAQEKQEKLLLAQKEEAKKEERRKLLGEEPEPGERTTKISFRLPGGEKVERMFWADCKVELLHLFLESLNLGRCEMLTGFPPKLLNSGTLQDEGLVPRGLIHVRLAN